MEIKLKKSIGKLIGDDIISNCGGDQFNQFINNIHQNINISDFRLYLYFKGYDDNLLSEMEVNKLEIYLDLPINSIFKAKISL